MRILVIDDEVEIRRVICRMLDREGFDVLIATNGDEGMRTIRNEPEIDIVITDIIMPEKDGVEIIREIKRDFSRIRILAISGGGRIDAQNYLYMANVMGADLTLNKPFVKKELLEAIQVLSIP